MEITAEQIEKLLQAVADNDTLLIESLLAEIKSADLAELIHQQETSLGLKLLIHLPIETRASVFGYLDIGEQAALAQEMTTQGIAQLFTHMQADERADLFNLLSEEQGQEVLRQLAKEEREDIRRLASYEEGTTGAIMTSDYAVLKAGTLVSKALEVVRDTAPNAETIYQIYILNAEKQLAGVISLRQLILANPSVLVDQVMTLEPISLGVNEPQEEAARLISRYDLLALPVIDAQERLVGIVTYDDAMDVAQAEATEDIHKSASVTPSDEGFGQATFKNLYKRRVNWLVLLVFANILTGAGIAFYEEIIENYVVLVFFLPLLVASGGNAGAQAATLVTRGLATGELLLGHWLRLVRKELLVASLLGLSMALAIVGIGYWRGGTDVALVVASSMLAIVIMGSLIGLCLPFILLRVGWDPATASGPLVTSLADIIGVLIYFAIASSVLGL